MVKYLMNTEEDTLAATLARMTARDGLSFRVCATSPDIRKGLHARGFGDVPTSADGVRQRVINYAQKVRSFVMAEL